MITAKLMRQAGVPDNLILRVLELEQDERLAARREQNRTNQRNYRKANKINGHVIHVSADSADSADKEGVSLAKKEIPPTPPKERNSTLPPECSLRSHGAQQASKRGTRLPDDWKPNNGDAEFALKILPKDWRIEADKFADYWHARPGQQGVKLDWSATWRNWIRKAAETKGYAPEPSLFNGHTSSFYPKGYVPE